MIKKFSNSGTGFLLFSGGTMARRLVGIILLVFVLVGCNNSPRVAKSDEGLLCLEWPWGGSSSPAPKRTPIPPKEDEKKDPTQTATTQWSH
jgi:hypothetical protein